ncbi:MAG: class I lanthipeptide [Bacteroidota bacterium]
MKKNKFHNKLTLNKNVISKMSENRIVGAGPTWWVTCAEDCITLNAKNFPCQQPIYTEFCAPSEGC